MNTNPYYASNEAPKAQSLSQQQLPQIIFPKKMNPNGIPYNKMNFNNNMSSTQFKQNMNPNINQNINQNMNQNMNQNNNQINSNNKNSNNNSSNDAGYHEKSSWKPGTPCWRFSVKKSKWRKWIVESNDDFPNISVYRFKSNTGNRVNHSNNYSSFKLSLPDGIGINKNDRQTSNNLTQNVNNKPNIVYPNNNNSNNNINSNNNGMNSSNNNQSNIDYFEPNNFSVSKPVPYGHKNFWLWVNWVNLQNPSMFVI